MGKYFFTVFELSDTKRGAGFMEGKTVFYQMSFKYSGFNLLNETERKAFRDKMEKWIVDINEKSGPSL